MWKYLGIEEEIKVFTRSSWELLFWAVLMVVFWEFLLGEIDRFWNFLLIRVLLEVEGVLVWEIYVDWRFIFFFVLLWIIFKILYGGDWKIVM